MLQLTSGHCAEDVMSQFSTGLFQMDTFHFKIMCFSKDRAGFGNYLASIVYCVSKLCITLVTFLKLIGFSYTKVLGSWNQDYIHCLPMLVQNCTVKIIQCTLY